VAQGKLNKPRNSGARWTAREMVFLENHYSQLTVSEIGHRLGRSVAAIKGMAQKLGCCERKSPDWIEAEKEVLRTTYAAGMTLQNICFLLPGRSPASVVIMARKLGLRRPEPFWLAEEIALLERYYPVEGKSVVARLPNRSAESVKLKASELGIKFTGDEKYRVWSDAEREMLAKNHDLPFSQLCALFPERSKSSVEFARYKYRKKRSL
jgi:hypothetical protein